MYLQNETYDRIRYTVTTNSDNERTTSVDSRTTFDDGSFQPLDGREVEQLPEVDRTDETLKLITGADHRTVDQHSDEPADQIEYNGKRWRIRMIRGKHDALLPHNVYALIRVQEP